MTSCRVGGLLLRPSPLSITASSCSRAIHPSAVRAILRPLHASAQLRAAQPELKPTPVAEAEAEPENNARSRTSSAIDSLLGPSPNRSRNAGEEMPRCIPLLTAVRFRSSVSAIRGSISERTKQSFRPRHKTLDIGAMDMAPPMPGQQPLQQQMPTMPQAPEVYPRLNPTTGRTVELDVSRGRDIVRGIGMLASLMARNRVRADFQRQRFHERPGLKRKRLKSER